LINSFRFCSFLDLPSLFSTVFDDEEQVGNGEGIDDEQQIGEADRIDDEEKVKTNHLKNKINYMKSSGHCNPDSETGLE
jgi:hypothetical protein